MLAVFVALSYLTHWYDNLNVRTKVELQSHIVMAGGHNPPLVVRVLKAKFDHDWAQVRRENALFNAQQEQRKYERDLRHYEWVIDMNRWYTKYKQFDKVRPVPPKPVPPKKKES